jgi:hypothetical protein
MPDLDAATVLLQWAAGGLAFCWVTTRHRMIGLGYGWLLRGTYALMAIGATALFARDSRTGMTSISAATALAAVAVLAISIQRKAAGVSGRDVEHDRRTARVAEMTGIDRAAPVAVLDRPDRGPEFDPRLDLIAPALGLAGVVAVAVGDGGALTLLRLVVGALFLGAISDAMLLGHWYLVQPGLPRTLLWEMVKLVGFIWPVEVIAFLIPTGMVSVFTGEIDDGWGGVLGWMWATCAVTTIGLVLVTRAALKERQYSAVMAATGLLYLAILTAFGTDLVARAVLG